MSQPRKLYVEGVVKTGDVEPGPKNQRTSGWHTPRFGGVCFFDSYLNVRSGSYPAAGLMVADRPIAVVYPARDRSLIWIFLRASQPILTAERHSDVISA